MSKFFEERKFYKFTSEQSKNEFTAQGAYMANMAFAKYVGMNPFEVEIIYHNGRERVSRIRVYDELVFVDMGKITGNPDDKNCVLFNSTGAFAHEFKYFIEVVEPKELELVFQDPEIKPIKTPADWKVLVVKNGKIEVFSRHNTKEQADRASENMLMSDVEQVCYIINGTVTKVSTSKQTKQEFI